MPLSPAQLEGLISTGRGYVLHRLADLPPPDKEQPTTSNLESKASSVVLCQRACNTCDRPILRYHPRESESKELTGAGSPASKPRSRSLLNWSFPSCYRALAKSLSNLLVTEKENSHHVGRTFEDIAEEWREKEEPSNHQRTSADLQSNSSR